MTKIKRIVKIILIVFLLAFCLLHIVFMSVTSPKSDKEILKAYHKALIKPVISHEKFKEFNYRKIAIKNDTALPTIIFIHGTVGSINDYARFLSDSLLQSKSNMVSYDRIGYNYKDKNPVQESIAFESEMLQSIIKDIPANKMILVGYSYGGPIALSINKKIRKTILFAPAIYSKVEPMPWVAKLHKYKLARLLVSYVWEQAAKEKLSHPKDLENFENGWKNNPNNVLAIHGTKDWIAPPTNSEFLTSQLPKNQFELLKIEGAGHGLVWSEFEFLKQQLLKELNVQSANK